MRLTAAEIERIKSSAVEAFGPDIVVRVFGSRLDDSRRGGDIDLHIHLSASLEPQGARARFRRLLDQRVGEREYDILVSAAGDHVGPVHRKAIREGVAL